MDSKNTTYREMLLGIIIVIIPALLIGLIVANDKLAYGIGVLLGTATAILILKHMEVTISRALDKPKEQAEKYAIRNYFIRYTIYMAVLIFSVLYSGVNIIGVLIGIMSIKLSAFLNPYINRIINTNRKEK